MGYRAAAFFVLTLSLGTQASACEPSSTPLGWLICEDPVIADLDERFNRVVGEAGAGMRAKFAELCDLPGQGTAKLKPPLRWSAAACVYDLYVTAIEAKGERVEKAPRPKGVHPVCMAAGLARFDEDVLDDVPLAECHAGTAHIPFTVDSNGWRTAEGLAGYNRPPFFSYRSVGTLPSKEALIQIEEGTGGTGVFSALALVGISRGTPQMLMVLGFKPFGDRCNRGLAAARAEHGHVEYDVNMTSFDFFNLDDPTEYRSIHILEPETRSKGLVAVRPYDDLERYASGPCFGAVTYVMDPQTLDSTAMTVTIERPERGGEAAYQKCFEEFLAARFHHFPARLPVSDLPMLAEAFKGKCLKGP